MLHDLREQGIIDEVYCPADTMVADMTKSLPKDRLKSCICQWDEM
jgi:hypothetical protein